MKIRQCVIHFACCCGFFLFSGRCPSHRLSFNVFWTAYMLDHKLKASTYSILLLGFPYSTILYLKTQGRKNKKSSWEQSEAIEKDVRWQLSELRWPLKATWVSHQLGTIPSLVAWSPQSLGLKVLRSSLAFIYCCCYTVLLIKNDSITAGQLCTQHKKLMTLT